MKYTKCIDALGYGANYYVTKEVEFVHQYLEEQVQASNIVVFAMLSFQDLHSLWLFSISIITQMKHRPCLIFDFTWSRLNASIVSEAPNKTNEIQGNPPAYT